MEGAETTQGVIAILKKHKNNVTAQRWLKDSKAITQILENHQAWNEDHIKIGQSEMVLTLEENIEDYLSFPEKIDWFLR